MRFMPVGSINKGNKLSRQAIPVTRGGDTYRILGGWDEFSTAQAAQSADVTVRNSSGSGVVSRTIHL